jgi:hypothetical protein
MTTAIWQSKRVLKSGKHWQVPSWVKNQPKGMSLQDWKASVADFKLDKLMVLGKEPKIKKTLFSKNEEN